MVAGVLALVGGLISPFYRRPPGTSASEYLGHRDGRPVRMYASVAFAPEHFSKIGFVFYLLAPTNHSLTRWSTGQVILLAGAMTGLYTLQGGLEGGEADGRSQGSL
jgi:SSS family solute:Na+ symporter